MKIGFIAMSGLRLCDTELLELGLTFPGVARRKRAIESLPSLGLLILAGMTPDHIGMEYLEVRDVNRNDLPRDFMRLVQKRFSVVCMFRSCLTKLCCTRIPLSLAKANPCGQR